MNSIDLLSSPLSATSVDQGDMDSIDLLSPSSIDQGDTRPGPQSNLEQISEERNNSGNGSQSMMLAAAAAGMAAGSASLMSSSSEAQREPTYDPTAIYQIDFDVEHLGKNKPQSKRMAMWKYGVGGQGHEAKLTWSTHSGKYAIFVDGEEIFTNIAKGSVLDYKWKWSHSRACVCEDDDEDSVRMRIIACRKPPTRSSKDFRCYEFLIGGRVFRDLPLPLNASDTLGGAEFQNEESVYNRGKLMSILDVIEPGWRADGFA